MNPDFFHYSFTIEQPSKILLVLMMICLLASIITGWAMLTLSKFFLDKDNKRFSIMSFQLPWSHKKFEELIKNIPDQRKDAVRMQLKIDYYFMPFVYGLLFFAGCYVLLYGRAAPNFDNDYKHLLWIPLLAWVLDFIENKLISSSLNKPDKSITGLLLVISLLKWGLVVLSIFLIVIAFATWCLNKQSI